MDPLLEMEELAVSLPGMTEFGDRLQETRRRSRLESAFDMSECDGSDRLQPLQPRDTTVAPSADRSLLQSAARRHAFQSHGLKRMQLQSRGGNFDNLLFDPNLLDDPQVPDEVSTTGRYKYRHRKLNRLPILPELSSAERRTDTLVSEDIDDLYEEEDESTRQPLKTTNVRASLSKTQLWWFDFKAWIRRQNQRNDSIPLLRNQIARIEGRFGAAYASFFVFTRTVLTLNLFMGIIWLLFVIIPMVVRADYGNLGTFNIQNLFNGQDAVEKIWIFYGGFNSTKLDSCGYSIDLAYFCVAVVTIFGSFLFILNRLANAQRSLSSSSSLADTAYSYSRLVLSWDYALTSEEAVSTLSSGIANTVKDKISDELAEHKKKTFTRKQNINLYLRRSLAWFLAVALMTGTGAAIFMLIFLRTKNESTDFVEKYGVSFGLSIINVVVPFLLQKLVRIEHYVSGRTELYVTLFRTFALRIINVLTLTVSLVVEITENEIECGGTYIGREFYKVIVLDTLVQAFSQLGIRFGYYYWFNRKREFQMPDAVLAIVYRQALVWIGTIVCPWMPLIGFGSFLISFLVYYFIVKVTCRPAEKRWSQTRNNPFYLGILAFMLILVIVPVSLALTQKNVPLAASVHMANSTDSVTSCGPFQELPASKSVTRFIDGLSLPSLLETILTDYIFSLTTALPLVFVSLSIIFYQWKRIQTEVFQKQLLIQELDNERLEKRTHMKNCDCESLKLYREGKSKYKKGKRRYTTIFYAVDVLCDKA